MRIIQTNFDLLHKGFLCYSDCNLKKEPYPDQTKLVMFYMFLKPVITFLTLPNDYTDCIILTILPVFVRFFVMSFLDQNDYTRTRLGASDKRCCFNRRVFIANTIRFLAAGSLFGVCGCNTSVNSDQTDTGADSVSGATPDKDSAKAAEEAMYYVSMPDNGEVQCTLCFRQCIVAPDGRGACRVRENRKGKLVSLVYGRPSAVHIEPVEKEPMHHMLPGTDILCIGTAGCNFFCRQCHNWHLSQRPVEKMRTIHQLTPKQMVALALREKAPIISFTYNEPTVFYEYMLAISRLAAENGTKILFHSNGAMNTDPLNEILKYTDAATIDLKGFTEDFYRTIASARLKPVLDNLETIKKHAWLEIVNLVIPTHNDDPDHIRRMCKWIKETLGADTPVHFSRFTPAYRLTQLPPIPVKTLENAHSIATAEGLEFVSIGNVPGHKHNSTYCPGCEKRIIHRTHFRVMANHIKNGKCAFCDRSIPGIWS